VALAHERIKKRQQQLCPLLIYRKAICPLIPADILISGSHSFSCDFVVKRICSYSKSFEPGSHKNDTPTWILSVFKKGRHCSQEEFKAVSV